MDYRSAFEELIAGINMESDLDKRKAFSKCRQFAEDNIDNYYDFNAFLQEAAIALEQKHIYGIPMKGLASLTLDAKLFLRFSEFGGPELSGNAAGLFFLAKSINLLIKSGKSGENFHLYATQPPMSGQSHPLAVYLHEDSWFDENDDQPGEDNSRCFPIVRRRMHISEIVAFSLVVESPSELPIKRNKIYRIISKEKHNGELIWKKVIRGDNISRVYQFSFYCEDGYDEKIALDLDDGGVIFYTEEDLVQYTGQKMSEKAERTE